MVPNHMADLAGLGNSQDNFHHPNGGGNLFWWDGTQHAAPFNRLDWFHNHDVDRAALYYGNSWVDMLRPAMGLLYCAAPVPTILYGTEHGFNQGAQTERRPR
jgi:hypothetical protein